MTALSMKGLGIAVGLTGISLPEHIRLARAAEVAGFSTLGVGELNHDAFAAAAAIATGTSAARIVTAVATWVRPPVLTALAALTVAELAPGRFVLGLGTMPPSYNIDHYGIDPSRPLARLGEYVAVVRGAMQCTTTSPLNFAGEFFSVRDYFSTREQPADPPPIHLAATRPAMAEFAGRHADGVLVNVVHTVPWLRDRMVPAVRSGAAGAGRRVEVGVMLRSVLHDGSASGIAHAMELARTSLRRYQDIPYFRQIAAESGHDPDRPDDALVRDFVAVEDAEGLRARCAQYQELVDWIEITPVGGVSAGALRQQYDTLFAALGTQLRDEQPAALPEEESPS